MRRLTAIAASLRTDPRHYQIAILSTLFVYGICCLDFEVGTAQSAAILATALLTQLAFSYGRKTPAFDPRSALISGLSLCLLLRTNFIWIAVLAAAITVGSKFIIRVNGKHIFNPTNIGLVATILVTGQAWVSPGQWGSAAFFCFLMACLGGLVVNRAARSDVTYAFLIFYVVIIFGRGLWLGDPLSIPLHQLQNGAFLLFAFFMISDPKTTPNSRAGRILYALLIAAGAGFVQFGLFRTNGLLWSLAIFAMTVPLIDRFFPGPLYEWKKAAGAPRRPLDGDPNEKNIDSREHVPLYAVFGPGR